MVQGNRVFLNLDMISVSKTSEILIFWSLIPINSVILNRSHKFFLMVVLSLFIIVLMGLFCITLKKLYNPYSSFTHYRNYRAKIMVFEKILD